METKPIEDHISQHRHNCKHLVYELIKQRKEGQRNLIYHIITINDSWSDIKVYQLYRLAEQELIKTLYP